MTTLESTRVIRSLAGLCRIRPFRLTFSSLVLWVFVALSPVVSQSPQPVTAIPDRPEELLSVPVGEFQIPYDQVQTRTLANGLRIVVVEDGSVPLVDVAIALGVGSSDERANGGSPVGIMSITATLLRRGGTSAMDAETLDLMTEFRGLQIRSFGGRHRSGVLASGSVGDFDILTEWVADVLLRPRFDSAQVERYRDNALRSLPLRFSNDAGVAQREWEALVLGREALRARPLLRQDIENWTVANLSAAHQRHYRPEKAIVAVAGAIAAEEVFARFQELFGGWQSAGSEQIEAGASPAPAAGAKSSPSTSSPATSSASTSSAAKPGFYQLVRDVKQGTLILGHLGEQRSSWFDSKADASLVLSEILGGPGPVSRLRGRLRDRDGLVYSVSGSVGVGSTEPGLVQISLQVSAENALAALEGVVEEVRRLREQAPPRQELELARGALVDALPTLFDTAEEIAGRYAEDLLLQRPHDFWTRYSSRLERVTPEHVRQVARERLRPEDFVAVWVGPELPKKELKRLGFDIVETLPERDPATLQVRR